MGLKHKMESQPLFLSPALPTELLWFIIHQCTHPTTLIVCAGRAEFLASLTQDVQRQTTSPKSNEETERDQRDDDGHAHHGHDVKGERAAQLLAAPLYQVAVARHIRIVFVPTVTHLRAFLSVFSPKDSKVPAPPPVQKEKGQDKKRKSPLLLVYGLLNSHRETSEWSVQGLSNTVALFLETAKRVRFQAVVVEPKTRIIASASGEEQQQQEAKEAIMPQRTMDGLLTEKIPILSGSAQRIGGSGAAGWTGKTVDVRQVLGRWFRFMRGDWEHEEKVSNETRAPPSSTAIEIEMY